MNPAHGGPAQGIRHSIPSLLNLGIANEVVCCDSEQASWIGSDPFPVHAVGPGKFSYAYSAHLQSWLGHNLPRFDAVIVHGLWQWPSQATLRSLRNLKASRTKLLAGREPLLYVMPHGMLDPWFQRDPSRRLKAFRNSIYWSFFERHVVNSSNALLFTCEEELRLARGTFRGYRPKREVNIGYGIAEPPVFNSRMHAAFHSKCPELRSKPYFLFLGRIHPKKGVDLLIQAYEAVLKTESLKTTVFPDLVIAGPGWDSNYGRELKASLPQPARVHALDMLEGDAKWGALHGCQAFILPSHQENFGIAVVEALACNKPVLISDKVNIWREIEKDGAGFVAPDSLEGTIKLLMAQKNQPPEPHTTRFRDCFSKHFCIHSATQKMSAFFEESSLCR